MEHRTPGTVFDGFTAQMVRFLCGDELADMLGVDSRGWTSLLSGPLRLFESLSGVARGGDRAPLRIPQELAERWDVRMAQSVLG
jgi:hypothetical protein